MEKIRKSPPRLPLSIRFWRHVKKDPFGCWEWTGANDGRGYGVFQMGRGVGTRKAHRVAWELEVGPVPVGKELCHGCDNPPCVRPSHMFVGTHAENMRDSKRKGRTKGPASHKHPKTKLNWDQVREVRASTEGPRALGRKLGVSHATIIGIRKGRTWREDSKSNTT